jgi:hypothetical protein
MFNPRDSSSKKKSLPFGKPFTISLHKYHRLTVVGKYDGDVYVLFVSSRGKNKWLSQQSKIKFRGTSWFEGLT